jgi:hypothetical protein
MKALAIPLSQATNASAHVIKWATIANSPRIPAAPARVYMANAQPARPPIVSTLRTGKRTIFT